MASLNTSRLKSQLLTSGLQQKDSALFQVINSLIGVIESLSRELNTKGTGSGGGGGTVINEITNETIIISSGDSVDGNSSGSPEFPPGKNTEIEYFGDHLTPRIYKEGDIVTTADEQLWLCVKDGTTTPPVPWPGSAIAVFPPHAPTHRFDGTDPVDLLTLAGYPGGSTLFLRADGTFAVPAGGAILPTAALGQVLISQGVGVNPIFSPDVTITNLVTTGTITGPTITTINTTLADTARLSLTNIFTGPYQQISNSNPFISLYHTGSPLNQKEWGIQSNTALIFFTRNDDQSNYAVMGTLSRTGNLQITGLIDAGSLFTIGGVTSSNPAWRRNGPAWDAVLADQSQYTGIRAYKFVAIGPGNSFADLTVTGGTNFTAGVTITAGGLSVTGPANITGTINGGEHLILTYYVYPGRVDVAGQQASWYLASHGGYGLYCSAGFYVNGSIWAVGTLYPSGDIYLQSVVGNANARYERVGNAGSNAYFGIESSTSSTFGAYPYSLTIYADSGYGISIMAVAANSFVRYSIAGAWRFRMWHHGGFTMGAGVDTDAGANNFALGTVVPGNEFVRFEAAGTAQMGGAGTGLSTRFGFYNAAGLVGTITCNGAATQYNTSSDIRLKRDLGLVTSTRVLENIKIHKFSWIRDGSESYGVFAQEAYEIAPHAITPGDDTIDSWGLAKRGWGVDYSKFVPDLIVGWKNHEARLKRLEELL